MSCGCRINILTRLVSATLWATIGWAGGTNAFGDSGERPADFGLQWLRQRPLTVMGAVLLNKADFDLDEYLNMNLNTVFANNEVGIAEAAAAAGIPWHMHYAPPRPYAPYNGGQQLVINSIINHSYGAAWMLPDEPATEEEIQNVAQSGQWMRDNHPELLTYITVFQDNVATLNHIVDTIEPDALVFDRYPFRSNGSTDTNGWFQIVMNVRQVSLAHQIPFGGWLQSYHYPGHDVRTPSESDTRFNGFTLLTTGYTMLNYFIYDQYPGSNSVVSPLFDANGDPTALYHQAADANAEYINIGQSLRYLLSTDVRFVPGNSTIITANTPPTGLSNWSPGAGTDARIQSVTVDAGQIGADKNGLIGFFTDDDGEHYFMLTNLNHGANVSAAAAALNFTIVFDSSVDSIWRLNRRTGFAEEFVLSNHVLTLTLPGGTGDLFKYDNGNFVGLVPEPASLMLLGLGWMLTLRRRYRSQLFF